jgi:hypothetical protein
VLFGDLPTVLRAMPAASRYRAADLHWRPAPATGSLCCLPLCYVTNVWGGCMPWAIGCPCFSLCATILCLPHTPSLLLPVLLQPHLLPLPSSGCCYIVVLLQALTANASGC